MPWLTMKRWWRGDQVDKLRQAADLAAESLRLVTLRYQAGESPALELVDAQTTLIAARNAYDDAEVRYRTALATPADVYGGVSKT